MRMHFPVGQRVPARPLPGEEYGESKNTTESDWFARGFCNYSDADRNLEPSRDRRLMQLCECADSFHNARGRIAVCRRHLSGASTCESSEVSWHRERNRFITRERHRGIWFGWLFAVIK